MKQFVCENLAIGYDGNVVQSNINLEIDKADYLCIVGRNGAGKSTLIKTILGLIPPISGKMVLGDNLKSVDIGYLPQQTQIQKDFPASVWEVVLSGCINKHGMRCFYNREEKEKAIQLLEKIGILELKNKSYSKLSGGQQQRVLLVRALCATNKVLLLDEPMAGLDTESVKELYETVKKLNNEGTTIIMITHEIENALPYANFVLNMDENAVFMKKEEYISMIKDIVNE